MKDLTFRKAGLNDFDQFYPFFKTLVKGNFPQYTQTVQSYFVDADYSESFLKKELRENRKNLYLALHTTDIIGFLLTAKADGGVAFAFWLAVDPQFQNHGCASSLLSLWGKDTIKDGGHTVFLWTSKNNIPFYKKRGFTLMGEYPHSWFGLDSYFFYKTLAPADEKNYLREYLLKNKK